MTGFHISPTKVLFPSKQRAGLKSVITGSECRCECDAASSRPQTDWRCTLTDRQIDRCWPDAINMWMSRKPALWYLQHLFQTAKWYRNRGASWSALGSSRRRSDPYYRYRFISFSIVREHFVCDVIGKQVWHIISVQVSYYTTPNKSQRFNKPSLNKHINYQPFCKPWHLCRRMREPAGGSSINDCYIIATRNVATPRPWRSMPGWMVWRHHLRTRHPPRHHTPSLGMLGSLSRTLV